MIVLAAINDFHRGLHEALRETFGSRDIKDGVGGVDTEHVGGVDHAEEKAFA